MFVDSGGIHFAGGCMDFAWDSCTADSGVADSARKKRTSSSRRCADQHVKRQCHTVAKPAAPAHGMDVGHGQVLHGAKSRGGAGSTRKSMLEIAR